MHTDILIFGQKHFLYLHVLPVERLVVQAMAKVFTLDSPTVQRIQQNGRLSSGGFTSCSCPLAVI